MERFLVSSDIERTCTARGQTLFIQIPLGFMLLAAICCTDPLAHADENKAEVPRETHGATVDTWQKRRLFEPTPTELADEKRGEVMIYEGLTRADVDSAMTDQFDRIEAMMFVGTVLTDAQGKPQLDSKTKEPLVEDDGC